MNAFADYQLRLANERRDEQIRQAEQARLCAKPSQPIRWHVGASIARIGARLAGEPLHELARSL